MDFKKDYYAILETQGNASPEDLRAAYRRMVKLHHPDRNPNASNGERIKEINEAYDVLSNPASKATYDEFQRQSKSTQDSSIEVVTTNCRKFKKPYTVKTEERVYMTGRITVKYWAEPLSEALQNLSETDYKLHPSETVLYVKEENIYARKPPDYPSGLVDEAEIFRMPLHQPLRTRITTATTEEWYNLPFSDIRIRKPVLKDVTKSDGLSFGTLEADFIGYTTRITEEEKFEEVTECFGETGRVESKLEGSDEFFRKEYFYSDCTTYWGEWMKLPRFKASMNAFGSSTVGSTNRTWSGFSRNSTAFRYQKGVASGCGGFAWLVPLLGFFIMAPYIMLPFLGAFALIYLIARNSMVTVWITRLIAFGVLGFAISAIFLGLFSVNPGQISKRQPGYDTLFTEQKAIKTNSEDANSADTVISHHIKWKDYAGVPYELNLSVLSSDVSNSRLHHRQLANHDISSTSAIYRSLIHHDTPSLTMVYHSFDSIRNARSLDEKEFADMIVSCIQSLPYILVVDRECQPSLYQSEFIRSYLRNCNDACCLGDMDFGVQAPAEFVSNLKGDCDTRVVFLYAVLKHFGYAAAILTSEHYQHAVLGIHLKTPSSEGINIVRRGELNFLLWETTHKGYQAGELPAACNNLSYWKLNLVNN